MAHPYACPAMQTLRSSLLLPSIANHEHGLVQGSLPATALGLVKGALPFPPLATAYQHG